MKKEKQPMQVVADAILPVSVPVVAKKKLDISYGPAIPEGFERFDVLKLDEGAGWPYEANSIEEIYSAYVLCRMKGRARAAFMEAAYRVLVPGGKMTILNPYWSGARAVQDYTFEWPPIVEQSFLYFNKQWRKDAMIDYPLTCDFDFGYGYTYDAETQGKNDDTRSWWIKHYINTAQDLQVVMTKRT